MFKDSVWPILTSALVPILTTEHTAFSSKPIAISQVMSKDTRLFQDHDKILSEARRLDEMLRLDSLNEPAPSRIPEFKASLEVEKNKVLQVIRAGKKLATSDIQRRFDNGDVDSIKRQSIQDEDDQLGGLLMKWGSTSAGIAVVHNSALGQMAAGLTKAMSRIEKLFKHDIAG